MSNKKIQGALAYTSPEIFTVKLRTFSKNKLYSTHYLPRIYIYVYIYCTMLTLLNYCTYLLVLTVLFPLFYKNIAAAYNYLGFGGGGSGWNGPSAALAGAGAAGAVAVTDYG